MIIRLLLAFLLPLLLCADPSDQPPDPNAPKLLYLSHEPLPDTLYVGQTLMITYNALIAEPDYEQLSATLGESDGVRRLSGDPVWRRVDDNRRRLTVYYQVTANRISFGSLDATLSLPNGAIDTARIEPIRAAAQRVGTNASFSGVVAENLTVVTHKLEQFNDTQNILAMELRGEMSNLEKFSLGNGVQDEGIDWVEHKLPVTRIFYYAMISPAQTEITFNYFKPSSGDFNRISFPFDMSNVSQRSSTHADINPKKRAFPWVNVLILLFVSIAAIAVFVKTRKPIFLVLVALVVVGIFWLVIRDDDAVIKGGVQVRLLPTATSTLFYVTDAPTNAIILKEKNNWVKVLLPDAKIGWVKADEIY